MNRQRGYRLNGLMAGIGCGESIRRPRRRHRLDTSIHHQFLSLDFDSADESRCRPTGKFFILDESVWPHRVVTDLSVKSRILRSLNRIRPSPPECSCNAITPSVATGDG